MLKLDKKDIQILSILQRDGRIAKTTLAERVNLSPTPCWERLKRLEKAGIIEAYTASISWTKLGVHMTLIMEAAIDNHHAADFEMFEQEVLKHDAILECWAVSGGLDYFLKIAVKNMDEYQTLVSELLNADIGLKRYQTYVVTRRVKASSALPDSLLNTLQQH